MSECAPGSACTAASPIERAAMTPRILLRTHYQAHEPRIIIRLVTRCASATASRHDERLAASLRTEVRAWEPKLAFSLPAAVYALDNARALGFLNPSNRWTSAGLCLAYIDARGPDDSGSPRLDLTPTEARLYLLQYLIGTGALALRFGAWLLSHGETSDEQLGRQGVIEALLVQTLDDYLALTTDVRARTAIRRERDRLRVMRYDEKTRRHKRRPIVATLQRLRLLEVSTDGKNTIRPDGRGRLAGLLRLVPSTEELERLALSRDRLREVASQVYSEDATRSAAGGDPSAVAAPYAFAMRLGLQACPLEYLDDVLFADGVPVRPNETDGGAAERLLSELHESQPREVRFHVDRRGRRAFVVLSDAELHRLQPTDGAP